MDRWRLRRFIVLSAAIGMIVAGHVALRMENPARAQTAPANGPGYTTKTPAPSNTPVRDDATLPPRPAPAWGGYPFPRYLDAEIADSDAHRVLYQDANVMFMEVNNAPGLDIRMHGHPYPSVFARDSNTGERDPKLTPPPGTELDPSSPFGVDGWGQAPPPKGLDWPRCTTGAPQAPHRPYNADVAPNHFVRLEFFRLDGADIQTKWRDWYPQAANAGARVADPTPASAGDTRFSDAWPYAIAYDEVTAAPANYRLLYEDGHYRLVEVLIRPGETTPMHGHPYPSVIAHSEISDLSRLGETYLEPNGARNGQGAGHAGAPKKFNMTVPTCDTIAPQAPHKIHNGSTAPLHYYRIEFKRIDGAALSTRWREWYPWMQYMPYMR